MNITFLGTNGSCSFNNDSRKKYGTNTSCTVVKVGGETLIFDAGTGICGFHNLAEYQSNNMHLFLSHYHIDHVEGLLFCSALFDSSVTFNIYGGGDVRDILSKIIAPPLSPVIGSDVFLAKINFHTVKTDTALKLSNGVTIRAHALSHPGGSLGYRVDYNGKSFCYCNDVELENHKTDKKLSAFIKNADLLVLDSAFADGCLIPGWGHSTPSECAEWATQASVKQLGLCHYSFNMSDDDIDALENSAHKIFANTFAAADGTYIAI